MAVYDLERRTREFAITVRRKVSELKPCTANFEDGKQVVRSSGSIGANYIEANENIGKKDFLMRLKIARKEAKETVYWLEIIQTVNALEEDTEWNELIDECEQPRKILSSIINKAKT